MVALYQPLCKMHSMYRLINSSQESWDSGAMISLTVLFCRVQRSPVTLLKVAQVVSAGLELEPGLSDSSVCTLHPCLPSSYWCLCSAWGKVLEMMWKVSLVRTLPLGSFRFGWGGANNTHKTIVLKIRVHLYNEIVHH